MILLDTHIWVWWVNESETLSTELRQVISSETNNGLGLSIISCWEVAKLVEYNRLQFKLPVDIWLDQALAYPGVQLLDLTPKIVVESTQLPGEFHRDPADQIIVATARLRYSFGNRRRKNAKLSSPEKSIALKPSARVKYLYIFIAERFYDFGDKASEIPFAYQSLRRSAIA